MAKSMSRKKRLFIFMVMLVSWYMPGVVNKTIADVKELFRAIKGIFL